MGKAERAERVGPWIDPELAAHSGLFERRIHKIGERVYCAVGYNLANIIAVDGPEGLVIVDTGLEMKQGEEVLADLRRITAKPVAAIVYTHHHVDHVQGTRAFASEAEIDSGAVPIIAHESLLDHYIQENGAIGPIMSARAISMYNVALDGADMEGMNLGIGPFLRAGLNGFVPPTEVFGNEHKVTLAGVRMEMYWVPSEAHSELCILLPDDRTLLSAEVIQDHCFPNLYTLRGALFRDPQRWCRSIDSMREFGAEVDHMVLQHGTPLSGNEEIHTVLRNYRDAIQYTHDQTMRYANRGYAKDEIARLIRLPPHLESFAPWLRPFYGSVEHAVPQIYSGAIGWFDGDPTALAPTPREQYAGRLVAMMGGREAVLEEARGALAAGDPQFAAELTSYLIRIDNDDTDARTVKADAFRELGYASLNISWRGFYLTGARVLDGTLDLDPLYRMMGMIAANPEALRRMPPRALVELMPLRLKAEETHEVQAAIGLHFSDIDEHWTVEIRRGVAIATETRSAEVVATVSGPREALGVVVAGTSSAEAALQTPGLQVEGSTEGLQEFLDRFELIYERFPNYFLR
ncbi:MAG TPA: alkyl sulfatase dimerization domain-containing protein [Solirubrobacteraceae bacterium]|jgi:alkyl sulfatase BDS1-like metallo-beta-lactamase superfamily hydrolase|nr:alkyl sulfatase dimerization domain-containing protein [Solirubrobacteraceae bacterium]